MKKVLLVCFSFVFVLSAWAQNRVVSGVVTSADDASTMPGVNVVVKGSTTGTVTDSDGKYSISVPSGATLVISFIGFTTMEVEVGEKSVIDIAMKSDVTQLQEVVVNSFGEERPRDKLAIGTSTITGSAITQSGEAGLINGLAGKAAGVQITRNGSDPGAGSYIQLRGQSTITGSVQPLIVVDGMPIFNDNLGSSTNGTQQQSRLNDINPADIASYEVISSAAGAALWGSRALNGVIVIKTKKGTNTKGKLNVSYNGTVSIDEVNKMPDLQRSFGQGSNGRFSTATSSSFGDLISTRSGGADTPSSTTTYVTFPDGSKRYPIAAGTLANPHGGKNSKDTFDHNKDVFGTGHYVENGISLNSGTDRSQLFVSYSNLSQKGVVKTNSDYDKNTARVNYNANVTDKFRVGMTASYMNIRSNRAQQGSNTSGILLGQLRTSPDFNNANYIGDVTTPTGVTLGKQISYRNPVGTGATSGYDNPNWTINKNKSYAVVNHFIGSLDLGYDFNDWLSIKGVTGIDYYTERRTDYFNAQSIAALSGSYTEQYVTNSQWNTNLFATAKKKISDLISGSIMIGWNYNNRQYNNVGANVTNFIIPDAPPNLGNSPNTNRTGFNSSSRTATSAGFTEINATIADQVYVTLTGRAESASTFGPLTNSLFFYPSASAAWEFTKMTGTTGPLNFGKLRASYGVVGIQPPAYSNLTTYGTADYFDSYGPTLAGASYGVGGYAINTTAGNAYIRPEKKTEYEIGTDLRFLNDKLSFSLTAYYNKTTDAILAVQVAPSSGFTNTVGNAGIIENKGLEASLGVTWIRKNNLTWTSNFLWSAYRNNVVDLAGAQYVFLAGFTDGASVAAKGQPLGVLWGTHYQTGSDGKFVLDAGGFPQKSADTGVIGNPNPNYRTSVGNTITYKNISLYFLVEALVGGQMWNGTLGALTNFGTAAQTGNLVTVSAADAAAIKTYDGATLASLAGTTSRVFANTDGTYSFRGEVKDFGGGKVALDQAWYTTTGSGFNINAPYVQDASWARLREVSLSYTFNSAAFQSATHLKGVTIGFTGRNLLLWTPYTGIDPDTNLTGSSNGRGIDYFQNPNTRSFLFKLGINF